MSIDQTVPSDRGALVLNRWAFRDHHQRARRHPESRHPRGEQSHCGRGNRKQVVPQAQVRFWRTMARPPRATRTVSGNAPRCSCIITTSALAAARALAPPTAIETSARPNEPRRACAPPACGPGCPAARRSPHRPAASVWQLKPTTRSCQGLLALAITFLDLV